MITWGVVRLVDGVDAAVHADGETPAAGLSRHLDGLVAVAEDTPVRDVLRRLPAAVTHVVELGPTGATDPAVEEELAALLAAFDGAQPAVVGARPLADALKRIDGDVVVEGVARDGMLTPRPLAVIDRAVLEDVARDAEGSDGVALLLAAGREVRVIPSEGDPIPVRAARA